MAVVKCYCWKSRRRAYMIIYFHCQMYSYRVVQLLKSQPSIEDAAISCGGQNKIDIGLPILHTTLQCPTCSCTTDFLSGLPAFQMFRPPILWNKC